MISKVEYLKFVAEVDNIIGECADEISYDLILPNSLGEFGLILNSAIFELVLTVNSVDHTKSITEHIRIIVTSYKKARVIFSTNCSEISKFKSEFELEITPEDQLLLTFMYETEREIMKVNFLKFLKKLENNLSKEAKNHILKV